MSGTLSSFVRLMEGLESASTDQTSGYAAGLRSERVAERPPARRHGADHDFGDLNQDRPAYHKGARVRHETFGAGTVLEVTGFGPDTKVAVRFDRVGRKKLLLRYARLERDGY